MPSRVRPWFTRSSSSFPKFGIRYTQRNHLLSSSLPKSRPLARNMPIPKTKVAAPNAKEKAPSANGSAAPVSGEKTATSEVVLLAGGKPDKQAHEREQGRIKHEIDALQVKLVCRLSEYRPFIILTRVPFTRAQSGTRLTSRRNPVLETSAGMS